jgi:hypothetical protein
VATLVDRGARGLATAVTGLANLGEHAVGAGALGVVASSVSPSAPTALMMRQYDTRDGSWHYIPVC